MLYIHQSTCISHQPTFNEIDLEVLRESENNKLYAIEPKYSGIPPGHLRRMGRAVRMGVGSALPLLTQNQLDGIILGTANGGIEDCIKFLNQIIDYQEGTLTPTHFVQSTYNAIAGQLGMITRNTGYNITHVHRGLAFENALLDTNMLVKENPGRSYLVGGVDEISERNDHMEELAGWYKKERLSNNQLYGSDTPGCMPGEGAAMFVVNDSREGAVARLAGLRILHAENEEAVSEQLRLFLQENLPDKSIDLFLSGENGDIRLQKYYDRCAQLIDKKKTNIVRFKHATGEFQTVSALAVWLSCHFIKNQMIPAHFIKSDSGSSRYRNILIYNTYKGNQHSLILLSQA